MSTITQVGKGPVRRMPLWVKLGHTAFMAILIPFYLYAYGPTNFLYFCDVALLLTLATVWLEIPLLAGMAAVGILVPQMLWIVDFLVAICGGRLTGMTAYMFDDSIPLIARAFSLFHGWLPFLLLWIVNRYSYDRRAFLAWTALAWVLMLVSYFLLPPPPAPKDNVNLPVNVNYVFGPSNDHMQTWMSPGLYMALLMIGYPALLFLPAHLILLKLFGGRRSVEASSEEEIRAATSALLILALFPALSLANGPGSLQVKMQGIASVAISPDGKILATGGSVPSRIKDGLNEGIIKLWDMTKGREKTSLWQSGREESANGTSDRFNSVRTLGFSPDGKLLAGGDMLGYRVWDVGTGKERLYLKDGFSYGGAVFSPDGKTLTVPLNGINSDMRRGVKFVEAATGREKVFLPLNSSGQIHSTAFSSDGKLLATAGSSCNVTLWDLRSKKALFQDKIGWPLHASRFSPDGSLLVAAGEGGRLKLYRVSNQDKRVSVKNLEDSSRFLVPVYSLVFSPDGKHLFVISTHKTYIWEVAGWRQRGGFEGSCIALSPDGKKIAIGDAASETVTVQDLAQLLR